MNDPQRLATEKISTLLMRFTVPSVIGLLVHALYNLVDRVFVGKGVGTLGLSGITMAFPMMMVQFGFAILIGGGATALISISLGERKQDRAELILGNALTVLIMVSFFLTFFVLSFLNPILSFFGTSEHVLPYARSYLRIIFLGNIFFMISLGFHFMIRGEGSPGVAMRMMIIGAVLNMILDPVFIFLCRMGISGAALGTVISEAVSAGWGLWYYMSGKSVLKIRPRNFNLNSRILANILSLGFAPFTMHLVGAVQHAVMNRQLQNYGGDIAVASMGVIFAVVSIMLMPVFGISEGSQPILGYNHGARMVHRVKKTLVLAISAATGVTLSGFILIEISPHAIVGMFSDNNRELTDTAVHALRVFLFLFPIVGFQVVGSRYFQAVGKAKVATILGLSRQALVFIPMLLILPRFFQLDGVWASAPVADLISGTLTGVWLLRELKNLNKKQEQTPLIPSS